MSCVQCWHCEVCLHYNEQYIVLGVCMVGSMKDGVRSVTLCDWLVSGQNVKRMPLLED